MSKVIFKMSFKHPNFEDSRAKNIGHLIYIATRPGTDKTVTENDLENELNKEISPDDLHLKYINERPMSHGLFDDKGIADFEKIKEEVAQHDSFIWRGIVSIKEEDAIEIDYLHKEKWEDLLRLKMPEMAKSMGIPLRNFRWVAALHQEAGHPHVHFMCWDNRKKEERIGQGKIPKQKIREMRKSFTTEIFREERFLLNTEKNATRDLIKDLSIDSLSKAISLTRGIRSEQNNLKKLLPEAFYKIPIAPRQPLETEAVLSEELLQLSQMLPGHGRVAYAFMPPEVKEKADAIVDYLFKAEGFQKIIAQNLRTVEDLTKIYTSNEEVIEEAKDNSLKDLKKRTAQQVLKTAAELQKSNSGVNQPRLRVDRARRISRELRNVKTVLDPAAESKLILLSLGKKFKKLDNDNWKDMIKRVALPGIGEIEYNQIILQIEEELPAPADSPGPALIGKALEQSWRLLKVAGYEEKEARDMLMGIASKDKIILGDAFAALKEKGLIKKEDDNKAYIKEEGAAEFRLSELQKRLVEKITEAPAGISVNELQADEIIKDNLTDKERKYFVLTGYDKYLYDLFQKHHTINLNTIRNVINANALATQKKSKKEKTPEEIENDIEMTAKRFDKLARENYMEYDKKEECYQFNQCFEDAVANDKFSRTIHMTLYDIKGVLALFEQVESPILKEEDIARLIGEKLKKEIIEDIKEFILLELDNNSTLFVEKEGIIQLTEKGRQRLQESGEQECEDTPIRALQLVKDQEITKEGIEEKCRQSDSSKPGEEELKKEVEKILQRYRVLTKGGYLSRENDGFAFTDEGVKEKGRLLDPSQELLKKEIEYLTRIGKIKNEEGTLFVKETPAPAHASADPELKENPISDDLRLLFQTNLGKVDTDLLDERCKAELQSYYLDDKYKDIKIDYESIRSLAGVKDQQVELLEKLSKTLYIVDPKSTVEQVIGEIKTWRDRSSLEIDNEKIEEIAKRIYTNDIQTARALGQNPKMFAKEWEELAEKLGIKNPPEWCLTMSHQQHYGQKIWAAAWRQLQLVKNNNDHELDQARAKAMQKIKRRAILEEIGIDPDKIEKDL